MAPSTAGVCLWLTGVIARLFDLAGGRIKGATWAQVREAERRVGAAVGDILPLDDGFKDRLRAVEWRAQPHILDEAIMALFERDRKEAEEELDDAESLKILLLMWVITDVLDGNWRPPADFVGETEYTYLHIEPDDEDAGDEAAEEAAEEG